MSAELAAGWSSELGAPPTACSRMGPDADRLGLHRPGAPGHHPRRAPGGGQGPVPGGGRPSAPTWTAPACSSAMGLACPASSPGRWWRRSVPGHRGAGLPAGGPQHPAVRRLLPTTLHPVPEGAPSCRPPPGCSPPDLAEGVRFEEMTGWTRTSATWRRRPSTASCSAASTGVRRSTATPTPATTCSGRAGGSRSSTSGWSSTSPPRDRRVRRDDPHDGDRAGPAPVPAASSSGSACWPRGRRCPTPRCSTTTATSTSS